MAFDDAEMQVSIGIDGDIGGIAVGDAGHAAAGDLPAASGPGDGLGLECGKRREQCGGEDREGEDGFWHFHDFAIALC